MRLRYDNHEVNGRVNNDYDLSSRLTLNNPPGSKLSLLTLSLLQNTSVISTNKVSLVSVDRPIPFIQYEK
jgi:hypothetical protein